MGQNVPYLGTVPEADGRRATPGVVSARRRLLEGLSCPACGRLLAVVAPAPGRKVLSLGCPPCGRRWPLHGSTPVFVPPAAPRLASGPAALLHAVDIERWDDLRHSLERADHHLYADVFDRGRDDWRFLLPLPPAARILVMGAGWGRLAASLAGGAACVYAVDADPARARFINARAVAEGAANLLGIAAVPPALPFADAEFDLIVIEPDAARAIARDSRRRLADLLRSRSLLARDGELLVRCPRGRGAPGGIGRWRRLLAECGFARADDLAALPDAASASHVLQTAPGTPLGKALGACARHGLPPETRWGRALGWTCRHIPPLPGAGRALPGHWLLAARSDARAPSVLAQPSLPSGPWSVLAERGGPHPNARARFLAFDGDHGRPHFLVKVVRDAGDSSAADREFAVLEKLRHTLSPELLASVPAPLGRFLVHHHPAMAEGFLEGCRFGTILRTTSRGRRPAVAADLLARGIHWLARFHQETRRDVVVTREILDRLVRCEVQALLERLPLAPRERGLLAGLATDAEMLLGERLPLVCAHGDGGAGSFLLDGSSVRVVGWDLALFDQLPLGDAYDLIYSLALALGGADGDPQDAGGALAVAFGGQGVFSQAVSLALHGYCARLGIRTEWGRVILPLQMARKARLHCERFRSGAEHRWLAAGIRYLDYPLDYPAATAALRGE
ncbi:MAG: hypothetical protein HY321_10930 [Armatimonadetes bacterium]|nr:hypothetical protein [Armatimonadota bacterium]